MTTEVDQISMLIRQRLRELDDECRKLESALAQIGGSSSSRSSARQARIGQKAAGRKRPRKRAKRGQRGDQFVAAVKEKPGATAAEVASLIGVSTNQAHGLARQLSAKGRVTKRGSGYHAATGQGNAGTRRRPKRSTKASRSKTGGEKVGTSS